MEFKAEVVLEHLSATKGSADLSCEHQIAPLVLADESEPDTSREHLALLLGKICNYNPSCVGAVHA
jgi:hypothetical protein